MRNSIQKIKVQVKLGQNYHYHMVVTLAKNDQFSSYHLFEFARNGPPKAINEGINMKNMASIKNIKYQTMLGDHQSSKKLSTQATCAIFQAPITLTESNENGGFARTVYPQVPIQHNSQFFESCFEIYFLKGDLDLHIILDNYYKQLILAHTYIFGYNIFQISTTLFHLNFFVFYYPLLPQSTLFSYLIQKQSLNNNFYSILMEINQNLSFIQAAVEELLAPKLCHYGLQDLYKIVYQHFNKKIETFNVESYLSQTIFKAFYIFHEHQADDKPCIIYLHGLSSYSFEGSYLIDHLGHQYNLCLYDLRGHGRNQSNQITYGLEESEDLYKVICALISKFNVKKFILWGRSMGASTCLRFLSTYSLKNPSLIRNKIVRVVLDSAFCSFHQIAKEVINANAYVPMFLASVVIRKLLESIKETKKINLQQLEFINLQHVKCPAVFVYSTNDEVVGKQHSQAIIQGYGGKTVKMVSSFTHNEERKDEIIKQIFSFLQPYCKNFSPDLSLVKSTTPKKTHGLSLSISNCRNIRKHVNSHSFYKENQKKSQIDTYIAAKLAQKPKGQTRHMQKGTLSHSLHISQGKKQKNTKIKTSKQILEEVETNLSIPPPPEPNYSIKTKYSTPCISYRNQNNSFGKQNCPPSLKKMRYQLSENEKINPNVALYGKNPILAKLSQVSYCNINGPLSNHRYI